MKHFRLVLGLLLSLSTAAAYAGGSWSKVTVIGIWAHTSQGNPPNGLVFVELSGDGTGNASCATSSKSVLAIDVSTPAGAFAASWAKDAYLRNDYVTVNADGTGKCDIVPGYETMADIAIESPVPLTIG